MANITKATIVSELLKTEKWKDYKQSTLMAKSKDILLKLLDESKGLPKIEEKEVVLSKNKETAPAVAEPKKRAAKKSSTSDATEQLAVLAKVDTSTNVKREMVGDLKVFKVGGLTIKYSLWKNPYYVERPGMTIEVPKKGRGKK